MTFKAFAKHLNLTETEQLIWDGCAVVTHDQWKKPIRYVSEKVENHYWSCDKTVSAEHLTIHDGGTSGEEICTTDCDDGTSEEEITCGCDYIT